MKNRIYKSVNRKIRKNEILELIYNNVSLTREDIIRKTGINNTAVYSIVSSLLKNNFIVESGSKESTGGRKRSFLSVNSEMGYVIGVSIEHEYIIAVLSDFSGNVKIKKRVDFKINENKIESQNILDQLIYCIDGILLNAKTYKNKIKGIGIGVPGIIDKNRTTCVLSLHVSDLQNIPIRKELGREIRKAFIASSGCELVAADYSQIELRMISEIAKVKRMQQAFRNKEDIHRATAAEVWNVELKDVTDKQRYAAKAINFGLLYGMGQNSLARATGMTTEEARDFIHRYFDVYPEIQEYVDGTKAAAIAQGYVETIFGRRRYLPELQSGMPMVRAAGERMAINAPVQGSAADIMKIAMVKVYDWVASEYGLDKKSEVKILMQVHDELVLEVKKDLVEKVGLKVKKIMEDVENFSWKLKKIWWKKLD